MESPSYELKLQNNTGRGKEIYTFQSADGIVSKNSFREEELAIADNVMPEKDDDLLVVQGGYGFLGVVMADKAPGGLTTIAETSDRAFQLIELNLRQNTIDNGEVHKVSFYDELEEGFDKVLYAPRDYEAVDVVKNRISNVVKLLNTGDKLYIAGRKTSGINRYKKHLNSFTGETEKIAQDGSQRVYKYTKTEEFEPRNIDIETSFKAEVKELELEFNACEGLFSPKKLDEGSRLLIENIEFEESDKVLDLACGYGIIGTFLKKLYSIDLSLTDDNSIATYYAEKNLESNNIDGYSLENRDCLDGFKDEKFDSIVSNPPTHQGEGITDEMFNESYKALNEGGYLYLVYNQNMRFEDKLSKKFERIEILAEEDNYIVIKATK